MKPLAKEQWPTTKSMVVVQRWSTEVTKVTAVQPLLCNTNTRTITSLCKRLKEGCSRHAIVCKWRKRTAKKGTNCRSQLQQSTIVLCCISEMKLFHMVPSYERIKMREKCQKLPEVLAIKGEETLRSIKVWRSRVRSVQASITGMGFGIRIIKVKKELKK